MGWPGPSALPGEARQHASEGAVTQQPMMHQRRSGMETHSDHQQIGKRLVIAAIAASGERAQADAAMLASLQVLLDQATSRADALADQVHVLQARAEAAEHA